MTRGLKTAVQQQQQQQQMLDAEAAVQALVQKTPPLEVDRNKLKVPQGPYRGPHKYSLLTF